jgi:hypothetical protein
MKVNPVMSLMTTIPKAQWMSFSAALSDLTLNP